MPSEVLKPDLLDPTVSAGGGSWRALAPADDAASYVSYYYADELAALPVRAITKIKDNKSDPNLETGTYGLFSTCEAKMRSGIVRSRPRYIFFVTRPRGGTARVITGMYELGWWAPGSLSHRMRDFALAATEVRFVTPEPLEALPGELSEILRKPFRPMRCLDEGLSAELARHLRSKPDRTSDYLTEIRRMEQINRFHSTYRYPTWRRKESFGWSNAAHYLNPPVLALAGGEEVLNSSRSGWWRCQICSEEFESQALLKACPGCHAIATLRPVAAAPAAEVAA